MNVTRARASALLAGATALCATGLPGEAQTLATLHIGIVPIESAAEIFYAKDMGFFSKAGLDVDIQIMQGPSQIAAAMPSNAVDIGYSPVDSLALLHQKNIPVVAIAPAVENIYPDTARTAALVLTANSAIKNAKDLSGKTIAVASLHTFSELAARAWIDKNGGDSSASSFIEVPFPAMPAALASGRIDAAWVTEPFVGAATKSGRVLGYGFDGISKHFILSTWFVMSRWAEAHSDLVSRFVNVMRETAAWANGNPAASGAILAKYLKLDPTVIATMTRVRYGDQLTAALMQPVVDTAAKYNKFSTFPAQELIYTPSR